MVEGEGEISVTVRTIEGLLGSEVEVQVVSIDGSAQGQRLNGLFGSY